eukprot:TRINITY_DN14413_c0_g1_i2.p1 TRINITY_DN14413_c0_g1~~TRINITY_DN14413_c0_g1_i2.p1  ORF type:complete len:495 (+),score=121.13 TRINITY_DN14413_c0_g1_i2:24-1487(+)
MGGDDAASRNPTLSGSCPAFTDGCPYANNGDVVEWIKQKRPEAISACPAFKDGCPFNEAADMDSLRKQLEALPPSHAGAPRQPDAEAHQEPSGEAGKPHAVLLDMLKTVHQASQSVKESVGGDCPVFQEACPFKNCITSSGTPLALELETRSWGLWIQESGPGSEEAESPEDSTKAEATDEQGLATKLKEGTKEAHKAAETVHFVREFIKGRVDRQVYAQFVVNLYHIYKALEEGLEACAEHPLVESLHFPEELERTESLKQDAEYFLGGNWEQETMPSQVTREYVERLRSVAKESPELLVPHAYTRYLGDLSGGQVLRRAAIRGMKLPDDGSGVRFYTFKRIRDGKAFKNMYRARMDNLPADVAIADRMVVEANYAFFLNTRIFQELDSLAGFEAKPVPPPPTAPAPAGSPGAQAAAAGCPFAALAASGIAMPEGHPSFDDGQKDKAEKVATTPPRKAASSVEKVPLAWLLPMLVVLFLAFFWGRT